MNPDEDLWSIPQLFQRSWDRCKSRILPYLWAIIKFYLIFFSSFVLLAFVPLVVVLVGSITKQPINNTLIMTLVVFALIIYVTISLILTAWMILTITQLVMAEIPQSAKTTMQQVKPYVKDHIELSILSFLFLTGIFAVSIPTFFILFLIWAIWAIFTNFVFLTGRYKKLDALWASRSMIQPHFWKILGRSLLLSFIGLVLGIVFSNLQKQSIYFVIPHIVFNIGFGLFILCFNYEMFKNLSVPETVQRPRKWFFAMIAGWIILSALLVSLAEIAGPQFQNIWKNYQNTLARGPAPEILKKHLIDLEKPFQQEIGKINITPVLEVDDQGDLCGPDQCHRDIEVIYGGDKPLQEKIREIVHQFESLGWSGRKITESRSLDDLVKWFEKSDSSLSTVGFAKDNFHASVSVAKSNIKEDNCFMTKICKHARSKKYPYVLAIHYLISVNNNNGSKESNNAEDPAFKIFLAPRLSPTLRPTLIVIDSMDKDPLGQRYIYTNKTYEYKVTFPVDWNPAQSYDRTGIKITNGKTELMEGSAFKMTKDSMSPENVIVSIHVAPLQSHWYMKSDNVRHDVKSIEDLYDSVWIGGGLPSYTAKNYVTVNGLKALETTGSDEGAVYFIQTQVIRNDFVYTIYGYSLHPINTSWSQYYYQVVRSFEFL